MIHFSTMIQHFSHVAGYWVGDKYTLNADYCAAYFERAYAEQVKFVVDLLELTKGKPQYSNLYQIARILKVLIFHRITDIYGDVPYFDAGMGYYTRNFTPVYDKQQDIYPDMLKELEAAATALDPAKDVASGDMIYNGDVAKWKRFAYSLMLRLGLRLIKIDPAAAKTWVEKAAAGGPMTSIADNAFILHNESGGRPTVNRISQVLNLPYEIPNIRWSKTFIDKLQTTSDPRRRTGRNSASGAQQNTLGATGNSTLLLRRNA